MRKLSGALVAQLDIVTRESAADGCGSDGTEESTFTKLKAPVRSPTAARRHAVRFGTSAPNRRSISRSVEVWSKTSWETNPPRLNGETTSVGTRNPRPIGPATAPASDGSGLTVRYSPAVPAGAVGGGTWSKKPPFSS